MALKVKYGGKVRDTDKEEEKPQKKFCESVAYAVKDAIGKSPDFFRISASFLYINESTGEHRYRVNVMRAFTNGLGMPDRVKMTDSYFVSTDGDGKIVDSNPPLVKKYG
jgi:hypothetical protein